MGPDENEGLVEVEGVVETLDWASWFIEGRPVLDAILGLAGPNRLSISMLMPAAFHMVEEAVVDTWKKGKYSTCAHTCTYNYTCAQTFFNINGAKYAHAY